MSGFTGVLPVRTVPSSSVQRIRACSFAVAPTFSSTERTVASTWCRSADWVCTVRSPDW